MLYPHFYYLKDFREEELEADAFIASMGTLTRIGSAPVAEEKQKTGTLYIMFSQVSVCSHGGRVYPVSIP